MADDATVVAAVQADSIIPMLLPDGWVLHLVAVLESVIAVRVDVTPRISLPVGGRDGLGLLGKGLGDEDTLLWSWGALLVLVGSSLVLGVVTLWVARVRSPLFSSDAIASDGAG